MLYHGELEAEELAGVVDGTTGLVVGELTTEPVGELTGGVEAGVDAGVDAGWQSNPIL
jgi:hypothetical protein